MAILPHEHRWIHCHLRDDYVVEVRCAGCHMTPLDELASRTIVDISGYLTVDKLLKAGDPLRKRLGLPIGGA